MTPLVCACGHNVTVHWAGDGCKKCLCNRYEAPPSVPGPLDRDEVRDRLAAALAESTPWPQGYVWYVNRTIDALLPIIRELAAQELRAVDRAYLRGDPYLRLLRSRIRDLSADDA